MKFFFNFLKKHREQVVSGTFPSVAEDRICLLYTSETNAPYHNASTQANQTVSIPEQTMSPLPKEPTSSISVNV